MSAEQRAKEDYEREQLNLLQKRNVLEIARIRAVRQIYGTGIGNDGNGNQLNQQTSKGDESGVNVQLPVTDRNAIKTHEHHLSRKRNDR